MSPATPLSVTPDYDFVTSNKGDNISTVLVGGHPLLGAVLTFGELCKGDHGKKTILRRQPDGQERIPYCSGWCIWCKNGETYHLGGTFEKPIIYILKIKGNGNMKWGQCMRQYKKLYPDQIDSIMTTIITEDTY